MTLLWIMVAVVAFLLVIVFAVALCAAAAHGPRIKPPEKEQERR